MTYQVDPNDVLQYLNELGYKDVSSKQLKEFIKDLKKLIKYDERILQLQKYEDRENIQPESSNRNRSDIFENLYESRTAASKAKEVPKKEKVISVQIKKHKDTCRHKNKEQINQDLGTELKLSELTLDTHQTVLSTKSTSKVNLEEETQSGIDSMEPHAVRSAKLKPKASFIRPKILAKSVKTDPVALYHQYQAEWKRQKFPGEENHSTLRWVIREKMLGEPIVQSSNINLKRRKGSGRIDNRN